MSKPKHRARQETARAQIKSRRGGGLMHASFMAWIGLGVGVVSLGSTFSQWVLSYAGIRSDIVAVQLDLNRTKQEIERNFKEDEYGRERHIKNIERLDATIGNLAQLHVKIGIIETQIGNLNTSHLNTNEILKDIRRDLVRMPRHGQVDPTTKAR